MEKHFKTLVLTKNIFCASLRPLLSLNYYSAPSGLFVATPNSGTPNNYYSK